MNHTKIFNECFKIDKDKVILKKPYMKVLFPEIFINYKIVEIIGNKVELFGFFDMKIWNTYDYENKEPDISAFYLFPSKILTTPSDIRIEKDLESKTGLIILEYIEGDVFINSTILEKNSSESKIFLNILFYGFMPDIIPYNRIVEMWNTCNEMNGVDLNVNNSIIELIVAELSRNPKDASEEFRKLLNRNPNIDQRSRKMANLTQLPRLSSSFAAVTSAYAVDGITESINRKRSGTTNKSSPIEDAIL